MIITSRTVINKVDFAMPARLHGLSKITLLRRVQCAKADSSKWVTGDGIVIDTKPLREKASFSIHINTENPQSRPRVVIVILSKHSITTHFPQNRDMQSQLVRRLTH
jgi:hypothetical protein